jgi:hypothetical protein
MCIPACSVVGDCRFTQLVRSLGVPHTHTGRLLTAVQVPCAGGRMQGEFAGPQQLAAAQQHHEEGSTHASQKPSPRVAQLHSYAASFAVLGHSGAQQAAV